VTAGQRHTDGGRENENGLEKTKTVGRKEHRVCSRNLTGREEGRQSRRRGIADLFLSRPHTSRTLTRTLGKSTSRKRELKRGLARRGDGGKKALAEAAEVPGGIRGGRKSQMTLTANDGEEGGGLRVSERPQGVLRGESRRWKIEAVRAQIRGTGCRASSNIPGKRKASL